MREFFTAEQIMDHLYLIHEAYCNEKSLTIGLVTGSNCSALIDCGLGAVDGLRDFAEQLTSKPLICIATHGHPDHAGGAGLFGKILLHPSDRKELTWGLAKERRLSDLGDFSNHDSAVEAYAAKHAVDNSAVSTEDIEDGQIIDLGEEKLEILHMPGHTDGSVAVINRAKQYIFTGDAVAETLMVTGYDRDCMESSYKALKKLTEIASSMPKLQIYAAHYPHAIPLQMAEDLRDCCKEVLDGNTDRDKRTHFFFAEMNDPELVLMKHEYKEVSVTYNQAPFSLRFDEK